MGAFFDGASDLLRPTKVLLFLLNHENVLYH